MSFPTGLPGLSTFTVHSLQACLRLPIGWNAPRKSLLLVHPNGAGSKVSNEELNISLAPTPDYSGIAKAASGGELWAAHASTAKELEKLLPEAVAAVMGGKSAVLDAHLEGPEGKYGGRKAALVG